MVWSPVLAQSGPFALQAPSQAQALSAQTPLTADPAVPGQSPENEQLAQLLRGFLAVIEQDIGELKTMVEELKTSQEQITRDNAVLAEQIKVIQDQMASLMVKESEQRPPMATATEKPALLKLSQSKPRARSLASERRQP
jgi:hypothetical protein